MGSRFPPPTSGYCRRNKLLIPYIPCETSPSIGAVDIANPNRCYLCIHRLSPLSWTDALYMWQGCSCKHPWNPQQNPVLLAVNTLPIQIERGGRLSACSYTTSITAKESSHLQHREIPPLIDLERNHHSCCDKNSHTARLPDLCKSSSYKISITAVAP